MTREDIKKNLEFKAVMKSIRNKYPFIVGYELPDDFENKWNEYTSILPVRFIVSFEKLKEMFPDWELMFYVPSYLEKDGSYDSIYLSTSFDTSENDGPTKVEKDIENIADRVRSSKVIPQKMKINRLVVPSLFRIVP